MTDLLRRLAERAVGPPAALRPRRDVFVPAALAREAPPEPAGAVEEAVVGREAPRPSRRPAARLPAPALEPERARAPRPAVEPPERPPVVERREEPVRVQAVAARTEVEPPAERPAPRRRRPRKPEEHVSHAASRAPSTLVEAEPRSRRVEQPAAPEPAAKPSAVRAPREPEPRPAIEVRTRRAAPEQTVVEVPIAASKTPEPEPEIRVTIGRLEVRAAPAAERPVERASRPPVPSLEHYLQRRAGGGGR
jgi:hypothetical protein